MRSLACLHLFIEKVLTREQQRHIELPQQSILAGQDCQPHSVRESHCLFETLHKKGNKIETSRIQQTILKIEFL